MKLHALLAAVILAAPATTFADRKITYRSDRDHDGHYVKRTATVPDRGRYVRGGVFGRSYYPGYYPRAYGYGYGYGYPGYGYYYSRPSVVLSFSNGPRYRDAEVDSNDSLEMDVQHALRRRGYYHGAVDGDIGPGSRSAIRSYQADHRLGVTGRIDGALLRSLDL